jgi:hypothetical protein
MLSSAIIIVLLSGKVLVPALSVFPRALPLTPVGVYNTEPPEKEFLLKTGLYLCKITSKNKSV